MGSLNEKKEQPKSNQEETRNNNQTPDSPFPSRDSNLTPKSKTESPWNMLKSTGGSYWDDVRQYYKFSNVLGSGKSKVRIAVNKKNGKPYAIKSINKKDMTVTELNRIFNEIDLLTTIYHPFIIKLVETYQDKYYLHIVTEYCQGRDLYHSMVDSKGELFNEDKTRNVLKKLLISLNYCHSVDIIHRDIKPENILLEKNGQKLVDFGFSKRAQNEGKLHTIIGTPFYIAPEVLMGDYSNKCDIWSVGIVGYIMFFGSPPFQGESNSEIYDNILHEEVKFKSGKLSKTATTFLKKCLEKEPSKRYSTIEALNDPFINEKGFKEEFEITIEEKTFLKNCFQNMKIFFSSFDFEKNFAFKKLIYKYLMDFSEIHSERALATLNKIFVMCEGNFNGFFSVDKFFDLLSSNQIEFNDADKQSFHILDKIDYFYFIISNYVITSKSKDILRQAFEYFDLNNSNAIEFIDLKNVLLRNGKHLLNDDEISKIIKEASGNGKVITMEAFFEVVGLRL